MEHTNDSLKCFQTGIEIRKTRDTSNNLNVIPNEGQTQNRVKVARVRKKKHVQDEARL